MARLRETYVRQSLTAALSVTQPWGSANVSLTGSHLLQDFKQNRVVLIGSMSLRLVKGLSLSIFGDVERIHDQRALPAAGATPSEILLRRRELLTSYSYSTYISLSYRFGSTLNNVVNPRFGGGGGIGIFFNAGYKRHRYDALKNTVRCRVLSGRPAALSRPLSTPRKSTVPGRAV